MQSLTNQKLLFNSLNKKLKKQIKDLEESIKKIMKENK